VNRRKLSTAPGAARKRSLPRSKGKFIPFTPNATVHRAVDFIASEYGLGADQLYGHDRRGSVTAARSLACLAVRDSMRLSFPEIGRAFGNRDHSTIISAVRAGRRMIERDERSADIVARASALLGAVQRRLGDQAILRQQYARLAAIDEEIARLVARRAQVQRAIDEERIGLGLGVEAAE
jgi:hypothetical protein